MKRKRRGDWRKGEEKRREILVGNGDERNENGNNEPSGRKRKELAGRGRKVAKRFRWWCFVFGAEFK